MELLVLILIIVACIVCYKLASTFNKKCESKYGSGCITWWWAAVNAILLIITFGFQSSYATLAFVVWLIASVVSILSSFVVTYKTILSWGGSKKDAIKGALVQFAATFGIAVFMFIILGMFSSRSSRRKR